MTTKGFIEIMDSGELIKAGSPIHETSGKNLHFGKRVFVNSGCKFQDQGGIFIGDDVLVGHNCMIATLNHAEEPENRVDMWPKPVRIGDKVWIGANATILPGVTIGEGAIIAAGAVISGIVLISENG